VEATSQDKYLSTLGQFSSTLLTTPAHMGYEGRIVWHRRIAKLTPVDREKIIRLRDDDGMTLTAIAKRFSVTTTTIWRLLEGPKSKQMVPETATQDPQ
jgi:DNA invertase Pin-like site-specific DNA recombinase